MPLLLYPGYHKTGTTVMETRVLPALEGRYLGRHYGGGAPFDAEVAPDLEEILARATGGQPCETRLTELLVRFASRRELTVLATEALLCPAGADRVVRAIGAAAQRLADPAALGVLLSLRRQSELVVSRYLHDVNTKAPALASTSLGARLRRALRPGRRLPYSLAESIDPQNPPCAWPMCLPRGAACACLANGGRVSIHLPLYRFAEVHAALRGALPAERVAVADLTDPALRRRGAERIAALLRDFGERLDADAIEAAYAQPLNTQEGRLGRRSWRRGFTRDDLGESALADLRQELDQHYRESNSALASALPEFEAYLTPAG